MEKKLTWHEIEQLYDKEWVELIDYDWPEEEPYPISGIVRVHAPNRPEFDKLIAVDPPYDSAYVFVGTPIRSSEVHTRSYSKVVYGS